ncbi:MAG TPA: ABC transporter permease [Xanthobacteraceae bacterium]|jgi:NitT/TauT family transport system permease protein
MTGRVRSRVIGWLGSDAPAIIFGCLLIAVWEAATRSLSLPRHSFPPPSLILWSLYVHADLLVAHAWLTFSQTVVGFALSVIVGVLLGWAISKSPILFAAVYPVIVVLQVLPKEALAPLLVLWFGAGILSRTILAFLVAFFPMVINTIFGVRGLDPNMRHYAASLVCGRWQLFAKVEFPSALRSIFAGMKISVTLSVIGVVVAEMVAGRSGLGYLLLFASSRLDMAFSLAILIVLAAWGGALFAAIALLERRIVFWRQ